MVILKKISAATLIETLVASAIIVIVFVVGSLIITNLFQGIIKQDNSDIETRMHELEYFLLHNKIATPFFEQTKEWDISIEDKENLIEIIGLNRRSNRQIIQKKSE